MYTRDRSTPLLDTYFEGEFSLTAAFGVERDGRTIVMFRRNIREIEPSDHPLGPGKISGIYAKGLNNEDEFVYHGPRNRGSTIFEFVKREEMSYSGPLVFLNKVTNSPTSPTIPPPVREPDHPFMNHGTLELSNEFRAMDPPREQTHTLVQDHLSTDAPSSPSWREIQFSTLAPSSLPPNSISDSSSNELSVPAAESGSNPLQYSIALILFVVVFVFCC